MTTILYTNRRLRYVLLILLLFILTFQSGTIAFLACPIVRWQLISWFPWLPGSRGQLATSMLAFLSGLILSGEASWLLLYLSCSKSFCKFWFISHLPLGSLINLFSLYGIGLPEVPNSRYSSLAIPQTSKFFFSVIFWFPKTLDSGEIDLWRKVLCYIKYQ